MFSLYTGLALGGFLLLMVAVFFPLELSGTYDVCLFYIRLVAPLVMMMAGLLLADRFLRGQSGFYGQPHEKKEGPESGKAPTNHSDIA